MYGHDGPPYAVFHESVRGRKYGNTYSLFVQYIYINTYMQFIELTLQLLLSLIIHNPDCSDTALTSNLDTLVRRLPLDEHIYRQNGP